ncbi:hypothetical protein KUCAC02_014007 [Chaenocephalus aceratus]|uniref:Uncharacterized protein n=1 Tax=Chaenocephalus aceratus TaxID=36190 RepID=A0ACB9WCL1_CHAAC|nr:hypothetical protein KUCAC02_014007 [Chaenocephalus aceratus]
MSREVVFMVLLSRAGALFPESVYSPRSVFFSNVKRGGWAPPAGRVTLSLTSIQQKHSTACPAHCAKEKQPSDSADGDGGGVAAEVAGRPC